MRCSECAFHRQVSGSGVCYVNPTYLEHYPLGKKADGRKKACVLTISKRLSWQEVNAEIARRIEQNPSWNKASTDEVK